MGITIFIYIKYSLVFIHIFIAIKRMQICEKGKKMHLSRRNPRCRPSFNQTIDANTLVLVPFLSLLYLSFFGISTRTCLLVFFDFLQRINFPCSSTDSSDIKVEWIISVFCAQLERTRKSLHVSHIFILQKVGRTYYTDFRFTRLIYCYFSNY